MTWINMYRRLLVSVSSIALVAGLLAGGGSSAAAVAASPSDTASVFGSPSSTPASSSDSPANRGEVSRGVKVSGVRVSSNGLVVTARVVWDRQLARAAGRKRAVIRVVAVTSSGAVTVSYSKIRSKVPTRTQRVTIRLSAAKGKVLRRASRVVVSATQLWGPKKKRSARVMSRAFSPAHAFTRMYVGTGYAKGKRLAKNCGARMFGPKRGVASCDLTGAYLVQADLSRANFTHASLLGGAVSKARVSGTKFRNAKFAGIKGRGMSGRPASLPAGWADKNGTLVQIQPGPKPGPTPPDPVQTITFGDPPIVTVGETGSIVASVTSPPIGGGELTFASITVGACTVDVSTGEVTGVTAGTDNCTIEATAAAVPGWLAGTNTQTFSINEPTCAGGGECAVGDEGPGGGTVIYVADDPQSWGTYLEAAPDELGADSVWGANVGGTNCTNLDIPGADPTGVGAGKSNTDAILAACDGGPGNAPAAESATAYTAPNGTDDWFLPSQDELNLVCLLANGATNEQINDEVLCNTVSPSGSGNFWSSTQDNAVDAWIQSFVNGIQGADTKDNFYPVWPVRAFGPVPTCAEGGECQVGDEGPGGGTVIYVADDPQNWGSYIEAAPSSASSEIGPLAWGANLIADGGLNCASVNVSGATATALGAGVANTEAILEACPPLGEVPGAPAAQAAADYDGGGLDDWYLPSKDELNLVCLLANNKLDASSSKDGDPCTGTVPSLTSTVWSSSQESVGKARYQAFENGFQNSISKQMTFLEVWPVRAFGPKPSCAQGGACEVGDEGPGGGTVIYVADSAQSWGTYIEAAPSDAPGDFGDLEWGIDLSDSLGVICSNMDIPGAGGTAIGTGAANTDAILAACPQVDEDTPNAPAAQAAADYEGGGFTDWYLPSTGELNQLCRFVSGQAFDPNATTCAGGATDSYWSSTQNNATSAWYQNFGSGNPISISRGETLAVWPVRAFGVSD